ncbi:MAG TPA: RNA pseudouridine synthase, partial [Spirochaetota bacterium]|nr:RNA pseudouridine synthase [Spirochaetota bacterium]
VVENGGKYSETYVTVISRNKEMSYLDIDLLTGRTHQIRVHLSDMGYPIIGDKIYSRKSLKYKDAPLCLVSYRLSFFDIFSNKLLDFAIDEPKEMKIILNNIKN